MALFAYNETLAQENFPLTKEQALARGYAWQGDIPHTTGPETLQPERIPDDIADVRDDIVKEVLRCVDCERNYRVVPDELTFYRRFFLPLPRDCPQCRIEKLHRARRPFELWKRTCMCGEVRSVGSVGGVGNERNTRDGAGNDISNAQRGNVYTNTTLHFHGPDPCPNELETSYAPERPEVVYCEQCYQAEVL